MRKKPSQNPLERLSRNFSAFFANPYASQARTFRPWKGSDSSRGSALIMAAIFMLIATTLITVGVKLISNSSRQSKERMLYVGEAESVARAGLVDALGYFRRQTANNGIVSAYSQSQGAVSPGQTPTPNTSPLGTLFTYPDQAFWPLNNTFTGQSADSNEPWIGIVNEYPLDDSVTANAVYWARYEVHKAQDPTSPGYTPDPYAVRDTSGERSGAGILDGDGLVWQIISTGYVYKRLDKTTNAITGMWNTMYNQFPNQVVASARFATEFRKLSLNMPSTITTLSGGIYCQSATQISLANDTTMISGAVSTHGTYAVISMQP
jgi:hypothetical protein